MKMSLPNYDKTRFSESKKPGSLKEAQKTVKSTNIWSGTDTTSKHVMFYTPYSVAYYVDV
jgi:hypothetical protein